MKSQSIHVAPTTTLGKWSVGLIVAMPVLFIIGTSFTSLLYPSVPAGGTILADIAARPALALTMLVGMAAGICAFVTGFLAILKKERAILVYVACAIGGLLFVFLAGEVISPH